MARRERDAKGKVPVPWGERLVDLRRGAAPVLVWLAAAGGCLWLMTQRERRLEYIGLSYSLEYEVSASAAGTLAALQVELFQEVEPGQVVARLDGAGVEARIDTLEAQVDQLTAELLAEEQRIGDAAAAESRDWEADLRRYLIDETQLELDGLAIEVSLGSDRVEEERLRLRFERAESLVAEAILSQAELDELRLARQRMATRIESNESLLERTLQELAEARARTQEYAGAQPSAPRAELQLEALRETVRVLSMRMRELDVERRSLVLRSPVAGQVRQLAALPGQAVLAGEPIVVISSRVPEAVQIYLPENERRVPQRDDRARVARAFDASMEAETTVISASPGLEPLPQRLWRDPAYPEYGRTVLLRPPHALALQPGERVTVEFLAGID